MDTALIVRAAFATVGIVQVLKSIFTFKNKKLWIIPTAILSVVFTLPFIPEWVFNTALALSGASLFYDTIIKSFEKVFTKLGNQE